MPRCIIWGAHGCVKFEEPDPISDDAPQVEEAPVPFTPYTPPLDKPTQHYDERSVTFSLLVLLVVAFGMAGYFALQWYAMRQSKKARRTFVKVPTPAFRGAWYRRYFSNAQFLAVALALVGLGEWYDQDTMPQTCADRVPSTDAFLAKSGFDAFAARVHASQTLYDELYASMGVRAFAFNDTRIDMVAYPDVCDLRQMQKDLDECTSPKCTRIGKHYHKWGVHIKTIVVESCVDQNCAEFDELKDLYVRASVNVTPPVVVTDWRRGIHEVPRLDAANLFVRLLKFLATALNWYNVALAVVLFAGFPRVLVELSPVQQTAASMGAMSKAQWLMVYVVCYVLVVDAAQVRTEALSFLWDSVLMRLTSGCSLFEAYNTERAENYLAAAAQFETLNQQLAENADVVRARTRVLEHYAFCNPLATQYVALLNATHVNAQYAQDMDEDQSLALLRLGGFVAYLFYWPCLSAAVFMQLFIGDALLTTKCFYAPQDADHDAVQQRMRAITKSEQAAVRVKRPLVWLLLVGGLVAGALVDDWVPLGATVGAVIVVMNPLCACATQVNATTTTTTTAKNDADTEICEKQDNGAMRRAHALCVFMRKPTRKPKTIGRRPRARPRRAIPQQPSFIANNAWTAELCDAMASLTVRENAGEKRDTEETTHTNPLFLHGQLDNLV